MTKLYKIRDKTTGKFWNGDVRFSRFADTGKTWKKLSGAQDSISYFIRHRATWGHVKVIHSLPEHWEIVEVVLKEQETGTIGIESFLFTAALKAEASKQISTAGNFIDKMFSKGVIDDIEFIFKLKPAEGFRWVTMDRIIEARAQLRQLGVKTRTFRESGGMFGMMDRQQALRARLVLDVDTIIDLGAIRKTLKGETPEDEK